MRKVLAVMFLAWCGLAFAQDVTIINNFPGSKNEGPSEEFVLSKVSQHTYIVNEYTPILSGPKGQAMQMISINLRAYIDNVYFASGGKVQVKGTAKDVNEAGAAIVRNALWICDFDFADEFKAFSSNTADLAKALDKLKGYQIINENRLPQAPQQGKVDLYTFQRMVYELKIESEREVGIFLDKWMGGTPVSPPSEEPGEQSVQYLDHLEFGLMGREDAIGELAMLQPNVSFNDGKRPRRRNRDQSVFSDRIVQLLEDNNRILANYGYRFEDLQSQINEIRSERSSTSEILREEMAAMRELVASVVSNSVNQPKPSGVATDGGLSPLTIVFEKNAHQLSYAHRARLNKVVIDLRLNPNLKAIITGFADRTGNPEFNAMISQRRAASVQAYLTSQGVSDDRLIINFLGDAESQFANPADRKVEVVYVVDSAGR